MASLKITKPSIIFAGVFVRLVLNFLRVFVIVRFTVFCHAYVLCTDTRLTLLNIGPPVCQSVSQVRVWEHGMTFPPQGEETTRREMKQTLMR